MRIARTILFAVLFAATAAHAVPTTYDILLDLDNLASTGCTITGAWGSFAGVEERLVVSVNTTGPAAAIVDKIERQLCATPPSTFGPLSLVDGGDWAVGIGNGTLGQNVIEAYYPLPAVNPPFVRFAVVARDAAGAEDAILTTTPTSGLPLVIQLASVLEIPTLSSLGFLALGILLAFMAMVLLRRRARGVAVVLALLALGSAAWGITCVLDGQTTEWTGIPPSGTDSGSDGTQGSEIVAVFAAEDAGQNQICFRIDGSLQFNAAPVATGEGPSAALTTNEDTALLLAAPGVLSNDTDTDGPPPLEAVLVTGPSNAAAFTLNLDGSFSYTPVLNFNGADSFTYRARDGFGALSNVVTVSLTVTAVNDAPSFTKGADESVLQGAGAQTVNPWATAISPGPADESAQTVSFNVTGNTNAALFSVAPSVSPTGVLTYTPAASTTGTATITLNIQDNGGTANGGVDSSVAQTFVITVVDVNDAPSFTKGPDQTVLEDAGAQTVNPWATAISPGPPSESGQTVTFNITGNTNPGLFSAGPAVSPTGVLTYTPAASANGTATITLNLQDNGGTANGGVDTSAAQTFVITVTGVNDAPSFNKGADQTVLEDAGAQTVNPWATAISPGPADESGQTVSFNVTGNTNSALFSVAPAVSPTGVLTYTPTANTTGTATITLNIQDNGGTANGGVDTSAAQTFVITVSDINDAPSFTKGADQTVNEDAGAQTVNPWATAISPGPASESGQTVSFNITGNTNAGLFSAGPAVSPTGVLTYTPAANANGSATITLNTQDNGGTANGGVDTSAAQSFTITVNAVNDVPSFTKGADQTVNEDAGAQTVNPWATAISAGPADESGQTVAFNVTGNTNPGLFSAGPAVSATGVLTYTPAANTAGTATITLNIQDSGGTANGGVDTSAAQTFVITVNDVNDAPSFTKGADQTVNEDAGAQTVNPWATAISPGPASESGQTVSFNITGNTNAGLFSAGPAVSPTGVLTYTPAANANGTATITLNIQDNGGTANGGVDTSAAQTFVITVTAVNDVPSFTKGADQTVNEDAGAQTVNPWATAISAGPNESGQTLTFNVTGNTNPGLFAAGPAVASTGVLTYTPAANTAGTATITLNIQDNGGTANGGVDTSAAQTFVITVTGVNDAPSFTKGPDQTVNEDAGPQTASPWATAISPGPPDESGQTVTFQITGNTNPGLFAAGPAVSATGALTYTSALNAFGSATITLRVMDNGGTANGGVDVSPAQSFTITVNPVNDPPVADNDAFDFIGNTELRVDTGAAATPHALETTPSTFGVIDGDSDPVEGDTISVSSITVGACTDNAGPTFDCTDALVGTVNMQSNGRFSFTPAPGDTGASETFTYVLTDNGLPAPSSAAPATVTLTRFERVWYVKNNSTAGGLGRSADPFDTLGEAQTASLDNDWIFVHFGNGNNTGQNQGIVLKNGQHLIGEHAGLSIPVNLNGNGSPTNLVAAAAGSRPLISNTGNNQNAVAATDVIPVEIVGLRLSSGSSNAIDWTTNAAFAGTGTLSIRDNVITAAGAEGVDINLAGSGATNLAFSLNNITSTGNGLDIAETGTGALTIVSFLSNTVSGASAASGMNINTAIFDATPGGSLDLVSGGTTLIGSAGNGVGGAGLVISGMTGNLEFTTLAVVADGGAALQVSGTGAFTGAAGTRIAETAGNSFLTATGGPAASLTNLTSSLVVNPLTSTNSATTGVTLDTVVGTFTGAAGSAITNATGTDFSINAGNATVTYNGTISDASGQVVSVTNTTGGTKSFTGSIGSGSVALTSNTGATINFSGGLTLSTGATAAFAATGGGTVSVTGTNTLTTTTGTALNVTNTTIGSSGLTFRSIGSNGAATGIVLNNTGNGFFTVTGDGTTTRNNSGGTISVTGTAISLTDVANVQLDHVAITGAGDDGVFGTLLTDEDGAGGKPSFAYRHGSITNQGNAVGDHAFDFETLSAANVTGSFIVDNVLVQNFGAGAVSVSNNSGTLTASVLNSTIDNNDDTIGETAIEFRGTGTAIVNSTVQNNDLTDVEGSGISILNEGNLANDTNVLNNRISRLGGPNSFPTSPGININVQPNASVTFDVQGNAVRHVGGDGFVIVAFGSTEGRIGGSGVGQGNTFANLRTGDGVRIDVGDSTDANPALIGKTYTILVENNDIGVDNTGLPTPPPSVPVNTPGAGDDGIQILHRNTDSTLNLTILNNRINQTTSEAIRLFTDEDTASIATPKNNVRIENNVLTNISTAIPDDEMILITQDTSTASYIITGNNNGTAGTFGTVVLTITAPSTASITQGSLAAMSTANDNCATTGSSTPTFNSGAANPPLPANP